MNPTDPARIPAPMGLDALALAAGARLAAGGDQLTVAGAAPLARAGQADVTVFTADMPVGDLQATWAGACIVRAADLPLVPAGVAALLSDDPLGCFGRVIALLRPPGVPPGSAWGGAGMHAGAQVHPAAHLEAGVIVEPGAVIGPEAEVGSGTLVGVGTVIGPGVRVGRACTLEAHASLFHALVGDRVVVGAGARIGQGGADAPSPLLGRVVVQNGVTVGANAVVERGVLADTVIGEGCRVAALTLVAGGTVLVRDAWRP